MTKPRDPDEPTEIVLTPPPPTALDGQLVPRPGPSRDPFAAFLASCAPSSKGTMRARLAAAAAVLAPGTAAERYPWQTIDYVAVTHVLDRMAAANASPSTRNLTRAALKKMARVLFGLRLMPLDERQRIDDVPAARGRKLPRGRALDARQLRKLFKVCERDPTPAGRRDAALLAALFGGGLRRAEASTLDVGDVDAAGGTLRVQGKGGVEKLQPVVAEVLAALRAWLDVRGTVRGEHAAALFVVVDKFGRVGERRLNGKAIAWKIDRRAREAGIEPLPDGHVCSPHDLRRSFGTGLLEAGEDLSSVAKAMRHANISTTAIYDRRDERAVAASVAKLHVPFGR
jgi:integrase/recombinase XerD